MKPRIGRQVMAARLAVLALGALCLLQPQARAQEATDPRFVFPSVGVAPGQSLRLTLFNPEGMPVRARASVHSGGIQVALADGSVRAGESRSFDFKRSDIPLPGEDRTGRLQLQASFQIATSEPRRKIGELAVAMETVSISDGTSNTLMVSEAMRGPMSRGGRDVLIGGNARDILMGIVPGQRLRVTLLNPPSARRPAEVSGHIKVFDKSGALIAQSEDVTIAPGTFRSFDFDREALATPGEPGTDRVQLRIQPFVASTARDARALASFEIVDASTGETAALEGYECLVFFLGGRAP